MKKQLEIKKNQTSAGKGKMNGDHTTKKMKSQQTKIIIAEKWVFNERT